MRSIWDKWKLNSFPYYQPQTIYFRNYQCSPYYSYFYYQLVSYSMIKKTSNTDNCSENHLYRSRHDKTQNSKSKYSNMQGSGVLKDRSNKRLQEPISSNQFTTKPKHNDPWYASVQQQKKELRKNFGENKYIPWTPNNFKISSPRSALGGNYTHRDQNKPKISSFDQHNELSRKQSQKNALLSYQPQKIKSGSSHKQNTSIKKDKKQAIQLQKTIKKEKFFEYILKYSYRSKKGFHPTNPGKVNQDAYIICPSIGKKSWQHYFGICDGHGNLGHHVSSFIKSNIPKYMDTLNGIDKSNIKEKLFKAFKLTNEKLVQQSGIDLSFSGSTVVGCYLNQNKLYCCNVGDSRAIIGYKKQNKWKAKQLSNDHKPSLKVEADRILAKKGKIEQCRDANGNFVGPMRVWLKDENAPGLAMSRSFGDLVAASVGVSWEPQITQFTLSEEDRIVIIASDGVWEFLQNQEIISKLSPFYENNQIEKACDFLLDYAQNSWTQHSPVIDDISFVLIFMVYNT